MNNEPNNLVAGQLSKIKTKTFFKWVIKNFSSIEMARGDAILSPVFSKYINNIESKWQLKFYPKGVSIAPLNKASLFIEHLSEIIVESHMIFTVVKNNEEVCRQDTGKHTFTMAKVDWGFKAYVDIGLLTNEPNGILINDELTIICTIIAEKNDLENEETNRVHSECLQRHQRDLEKLLDHEKSSDVTFKFPDNNALHAHENILSARSTYFAAMFEHNMLEKECSVVEITDTLYDIFKQMFQFLYVGKLDKIEEMADELLIASNKYCLDDLKAVCENSIHYSLTTKNVFRYLTLANVHNAPNLKATIIEFITAYGKDIVSTDEYKLHEKSHRHECCDILRCLVFKKKSNQMRVTE